VTGLITGLHEPHATHLALLERVIAAGLGVGDGAACHLERAYADARRLGYLWHEFGDSHLIIAARTKSQNRHITKSFNPRPWTSPLCEPRVDGVL
jgi:S-adenosylmethionine:tRNA-ribosyltransferase-isomerase (queuine synthetase)